MNRILRVVICLAGLALLPALLRAEPVEGLFKLKCLADPAAKVLTGDSPCLAATPQLHINDEVTLAVQYQADGGFNDVRNADPRDLVLFIDGKAVVGSHPKVGRSQTDTDFVTTSLLTFRLVHDLSTPRARANWKDILTGSKTGKEVVLSAGTEAGPPLPSDIHAEFRALRSDQLAIWALLFVVGGILFFLIAARTGALRDKEPRGADVADNTERAFSLGRVQMALWTFLVFCAYLFIWRMTGEYKETIPESMLALMGLSVGTFGVAAALDAHKVRSISDKLDRDPSQEDLLAPQTTVCRTGGFWDDILTSADGMALHRLQIVMWTAALALIFIATVWNTIAMPDFDATLLALMGVSSAAYLGLKVPERKALSQSEQQEENRKKEQARRTAEAKKAKGKGAGE